MKLYDNLVPILDSKKLDIREKAENKLYYWQDYNTCKTQIFFQYLYINSKINSIHYRHIQ